MSKSKLNKIVKVVWEDTASNPKFEGTAKDILENAYTSKVTDVGFYLGEKDNKIYIASQHANPGDRYKKPTVIPKDVIRKITFWGVNTTSNG